MLQTDDGAIVRTLLSAVADIADGGAVEVEASVDGTVQSLVLLRRGDQIVAYLNICPHAGRRLDWAPGRFLFDKDRLVCAAHGASFEPITGECVAGPCRGQSLRAVPVEIEGDGVYLPGQG